MLDANEGEVKGRVIVEMSRFNWEKSVDGVTYPEPDGTQTKEWVGDRGILASSVGQTHEGDCSSPSPLSGCNLEFRKTPTRRIAVTGY